LYHIVFTVTNQLVYDQRMQRICTSLQKHGYNVLLIGIKHKQSKALQTLPFNQKRLNGWFSKGFFMYAEYNIKLFFTLLFTRTKAICAIDIDTILSCFWAAKLTKKTIVYDAHEWFSQQKEIVTRPIVHKFWQQIEHFCIPKIKNGYTVNNFIQKKFNQLYNVEYDIIRNIPTKKELEQVNKFLYPTIIYQGAVNEGRSFETLIPAMQFVEAELRIVGEGNFLEQAKALVKMHHVENKVFFEGTMEPSTLALFTQKAHIGITIFEPIGQNQIHSLANRFFDYMMAGIPQLCCNFAEYERINKEYEFAYMIDDVKTETIANALNNLLSNNVLYTTLVTNALHASKKLHWENESKVLIHFWENILKY
jgi:glycosyltransferase involved in cell wall biosynthesis